ncbi:hypothetical protein EVAR_55151_1 [Eumeta japonica]|uniref:Uncharacterized protein n=1 Tax=Eumeta variegata TaxID=151549 RepID=A0A4C1Y866_EUMVA|nr:hypothetical protein EVAR_55151_1 [Eumeta japonica]
MSYIKYEARGQWPVPVSCGLHQVTNEEHAPQSHGPQYKSSSAVPVAKGWVTSHVLETGQWSTSHSCDQS